MRSRMRHRTVAALAAALHDVRTGRFERSLSALTAAGAAITAAEIYLAHDGASFGNKMMWWPVVDRADRGPGRDRRGVLRARRPDRAAAGLARPSSPTACRAPTCTRGASRSGPAAVDPLQHGDRAAAVRAAAGHPGRRDGPARRGAAPGEVDAGAATLMPYRSPASARSPRSPRPVPRLRRARPGRRVGRRHRRRRAGPAGAARDLAFFTPAEGRSPRRCWTCCSPRTASPRVPVLALIDARLADRRDRRLALRRHARGRPGLARHAGRPRRGRRGSATARGFARLRPATSRRALIQAVQDLAARREPGTACPPPTCGACGPATPAPRSTPTPGRGTRSASPARPTRAAT